MGGRAIKQLERTSGIPSIHKRGRGVVGDGVTVGQLSGQLLQDRRGDLQISVDGRFRQGIDYVLRVQGCITIVAGPVFDIAPGQAIERLVQIIKEGSRNLGLERQPEDTGVFGEVIHDPVIFGTAGATVIVFIFVPSMIVFTIGQAAQGPHALVLAQVLLISAADFRMPLRTHRRIGQPALSNGLVISILVVMGVEPHLAPVHRCLGGRGHAVKPQKIFFDMWDRVITPFECFVALQTAGIFLLLITWILAVLRGPGPRQLQFGSRLWRRFLVCTLPANFMITYIGRCAHDDVECTSQPRFAYLCVFCGAELVCYVIFAFAVAFPRIPGILFLAGTVHHYTTLPMERDLKWIYHGAAEDDAAREFANQ